ncbi:hypothetical protein [Nocardia asiatica]|uniref:hypothetical protein n=1 Tax=Nocardia asiatica TaxID=209252 RepID=UPI0003145819|nr:hypothetical protein [Nocardia asiatica]
MAAEFVVPQPPCPALDQRILRSDYPDTVALRDHVLVELAIGLGKSVTGRCNRSLIAMPSDTPCANAL